MPLSEQQRQQLDGIVGRMQQEGESDTNIQFVVDDFKSKYDRETSERSTPAVIGMVNPATAAASVGAANVARRAAVRVGEELATSPAVGRVVKAASKPAAQAVARAVGVAGGLPGYIAGEALSNPAVGRAVETGIRSGGAVMAKVASSPAARAVTGPMAALATLPFTESGDRPAGETPERTANRQTSFAHEFANDVNRQAGKIVIPVEGRTKDQIIAAIAAYRNRK